MWLIRKKKKQKTANQFSDFSLPLKTLKLPSCFSRLERVFSVRKDIKELTPCGLCFVPQL